MRLKSDRIVPSLAPDRCRCKRILLVRPLSIKFPLTQRFHRRRTGRTLLFLHPALAQLDDDRRSSNISGSRWARLKRILWTAVQIGLLVQSASMTNKTMLDLVMRHPFAKQTS